MLAQYEEKMKKTIESLEKEYSTIRAGRANPHILDRITVLIMEHLHHCSRWQISQFQKQERL